MGIANFSIFIVFLSVVYEYFYFSVVDTDFLKIYSTVDFVKLTVSWLPSVVFAVAIGVFINYEDFQARIRAKEKYGPSGLKSWEKADASLGVAIKFIIFVSVILLHFIGWDNFTILQVPILLGVAKYFVKQLKVLDPELSYPRVQILSIFALIAFTIFAMFDGVSHAYKDLNFRKPSHTLDYEGEPSEVVLIRALDKGVLVKIESNKILTFVPWDKIKSLKSKDIEFNKDLLYKRIFKYLQKFTHS